MINYAIFDMDGLMFDTEKLALNIWTKLLEENNLNVNLDFIYSIRGRNSLDAKKIFDEFYPNSLVSFNTLREEKNNRLRAILSQDIPLKKGLLNILEYMQKNKIKMAIASSTRKEYILEYLERLNLTKYFSYIVGGDDVAHSKPNPEIFLKALEGLKAKKDETIILEDSKSGILAAYNSNIRSLWIPDDLYYHECIKLAYLKAKDLDEAIILIDNENMINVLVKTFKAKIILADDFIRESFYKLIKIINLYNLKEVLYPNSLNYYYGNIKVISLKIVKNRLYMYLDIKNINCDDKYIFNTDKYKKYISTPILIKIYDEHTFKLALDSLNFLIKEYSLMKGFDFFDEKKFTKEYLKRPIDILLLENLVYYKKEKRSKYNNGIIYDYHNVCFNILVKNHLHVKDLYITGNIDELGKWDLSKKVKLNKFTDNLYSITLKIKTNTKLEFKIVNGSTWDTVEKGIFKEEIINHHYLIEEDINIEDIIHNFNNM